MASIPLPALDVKPTAQPDILQNYTRLAQLQNLQQEQQQRAQMAPIAQQLGQQQIEAGQLDNQTKQIALKDSQAMTASMQQWDGKSIDDLAPLVIRNGGSANAVMGLKAKSLEMRQQAAKIAADDATTGAKNVETMTKKNDIVVGALTAMQNVPDDQLPQTLISKANELAQQGILDPQHVQMVQQLAQGNPQAIRPQLANMAKGMMSFSQALDQAKQQESARHNTAVEAQTAATSANTQAYRQGQLNLGAQRVGIENARLKFQQAQSGTDSTGQPSADAQAIASGHIVADRLSYLLARNPGIINSVMQLDPTFDGSKAQAYPAAYKDFTSGKTSVAINAGGTALSHLKELSDMNTAQSHIPGTPDYNAYQNKADTVASELAKFYGDATIPAIAAIKKTLTATLPGNRQAAIQTQAQSMGDKLDSFEQTWKNAAPSAAYQAPMPGISPKAIASRAALDPKYAAQQGNASISVAAPNGKTYTFKDQAAADAFKQKAGIR